MVTTRSHDKSATSEPLALRSRDHQSESPSLKRPRIVVEVPARSTKRSRRSTGVNDHGSDQIPKNLSSSTDGTTDLMADAIVGGDETVQNPSDSSTAVEATTADLDNSVHDAEVTGEEHHKQTDIQPAPLQAQSGTHKRFDMQETEESASSIPYSQETTASVPVEVDEDDVADDDDADDAPEVLSTKTTNVTALPSQSTSKSRRKPKKLRTSLMQEVDPTPNPVKDVQLEDTMEVAVAEAAFAPTSATDELNSAMTDVLVDPSVTTTEQTGSIATEPVQDIGTLLRAEHMRAFPSHESRDAEDAYLATLSNPQSSSSLGSSFKEVSNDYAVSKLPARRSNAVRQFQNQVLARHMRKSHWHGKKAGFVSAT